MPVFILKLALGGLNILKIVGAALKRFFSSLDAQGWIGLVVSVVLALAWLHASSEARHWKKLSNNYQALYTREHKAFGDTVLNYRVAAAKAAADDAANKKRVEAEQTQISERTDNAYQARIAAARATAERLRQQLQGSAHPGGSAGAPVPGLSAAAGGSAQAACDRLPDGTFVDAKLCATEQGIQLDELIKWAKAQAAVKVNGDKPARQ